MAANSLAAAARQFQDRINRLLNTTITETRLSAFSLGEEMNVSFRQAGRLSRAELRTRFGRVHLYVGQICDSVVIDEKHLLRTKRYKYTLSHEEQQKPFLRWEYIREPTGNMEKSCRHHVQGEITIDQIGISLNQIHVPTGYTLIEEVIRFCVTDLGVEPFSNTWHRDLLDSEAEFKKLAPAVSPLA